MTDQSGPSPWNNNPGLTPGADGEAPTTMTPAVAPDVIGAPPPPSGQSNRLKVIVAINAVIVLVGAVVIGVLLLKGDGDGSNVALTDNRGSPTTIKASKSDGEGDTDRSTTTRASATTGADQVTLAPKPTAAPVRPAPAAQATVAPPPAPTQPAVTLPPAAQPPPPSVPSVDDALGQVSTTLTEFMAADTRGDIDGAMAHLAPPVDQWVGADQRNFTADQLRADLGDPDSDFSLSLIDGPTLAYGPEPTPDGGWMIKVNYTMNANGEYLSKEGGWKCVNNDQRFLDTLVASPGGSPRISSHERVGEPTKYC